MNGQAILAQEAERLEKRAAAYRKLLEAAQDLGDDGLAEVIALVKPNGNGTHVEEVRDARPSGRAAVRIIVQERPGIWTLAQLTKEMRRRGWFTSDKGVEAAVSRLCRINKEGRRVGKGRYVFPADYGREGDIESDRSATALIVARSA